MIDSTLKNANILIVDDQQANIDILVGLLWFKGYTNLKTTTDPRMAGSLFKEFEPDLLLLDLKMPHLTGFQVMEQLKALIPANTYFPILILTADITPESKQKSLACGASDFLAKPLDLIEVELRINNLLKTRYFQQQLENQNQILEEISEFAENLINTVREPLIALDKDLRVVKASRSFYDFFKAGPEETIGKLIYDLGNHQWDIPGLRELLEKIIPEKTTFDNYEVEHNFSTIGKRIMLLNARKIKRALGKEKMILLAIADITGYKQAEEALRESEIRYRRLFEAAKDGILILDFETGKIVDVNPFLIELLGFSLDKLIGKAIWEIGLFKDIAANKNNYSELQKNQYIRYENLPLENVNGSKINVEFVSNVYIADNHKVIQCNIRDITTRKKVEEEIKLKNKQLIRLNSEKDKLFSIIAHDLRSPFHGLMGLTEVMATESSKCSLEEIAKYSCLIHNSVVNIYSLIENLLEWARFQKGLISIAPQCLCLKTIYLQSIETMKLIASQKGITLLHEIPETLEIYADEKMIGSVFRNLLSNAIKFTDRDGSVVGKARKIENGMVEVWITDIGVGIPGNIIDKLFQLGEIAGTKGTEGEPSTGLGLILCKEFVEKHGGRIWVESEEGKGSTFYFTLPETRSN